MVHGVHAAALVVLVYVPSAQAAQVRSRCAVPAAITDCPGAHVVKAPQDAAFLAALNVPLAHARQVRLAVAEPALVTYWPAPHSAQLTHALAGLRSWSQVPAAQVTALVSPPAQYCPTPHGSHLAAVPALPGAVCLVPGAQLFCGTHCPELTMLLNVPFAHVLHVWFLSALPAADTKLPAGQSAQGLQASALLALLRWPGSCRDSRSRCPCNQQPSALSRPGRTRAVARAASVPSLRAK